MSHSSIRTLGRSAWLALVLLAGSVVAALAQPRWLPGFHQLGLTGSVTATLRQPNGDLIVGGNFTNVGGHPNADYVVRWDGRHWQALGEGPGVFTTITALCALPAGGLVVAGTLADKATPHSVITRWDGHRWQPLGSGWPQSQVHALTIAPNGDLLAGFLFGSGSACEVLRWDGQHWLPLATNPAADTARAERRVNIWNLVVTATGDLIATGYFPFETHEIQTAAHWTGTAWQPLGPANVHRSAVALKLTSRGEALAGGILFDAHGNGSNYVARWDGRAWQDFGPGLKGRVETLGVTPTGEIQVTSTAYSNDILNRPTILEQWNGTEWQVIDWQANQAANPSLSSRRYWGADIDASWPAGSEPAGFAATYPNSGSVTALAAARNGDVLLATDFFDVDDIASTSYQPQTRIYRWNGRYRRRLGSAFKGNVTALVVAPNGDILAAGAFAIANGPDSIRNIARWDGHRWQPLGKGLPAAAQAIAVAPNGDVLAGGRFGLRRWHGSRWQPLPLPHSPESTGEPTAPGFVSALAIAPNGDVLAGGLFAGSNSYSDAHVIRWHGQRWQLLEGGVEPFVSSLAVARNGKIAVGSGATGHVHEFSSDWGSVVRSDTTDASVNGWSYPPARFNGYVNSVAVAANGDIIVGGSFSTVDNLPIRNLARWHQGAWQAFPQHGLNGPVRAVAVAPNGDIIVGGEFTGTGDGAQSLSLWGIYRER